MCLLYANRWAWLGLAVLLLVYLENSHFVHALTQNRGSSAGNQDNGQDVDYYKVLDLEEKREEATQNDIKQSYRRLSRQYHPDVAKSEHEKLKYGQINRAYEVLSNKQKRKMYDMRGEAGLEQLKRATAAGGGGGGTNPFSQFFGLNSADSLYGPKQELKIEVDLPWMYKGASFPINFTKQVVCKRCKGSGDDLKSPIVKCPQCQGQGAVWQRVIFGFGMHRDIQQICPGCSGSGKKAQRKCPVCRGQKVHKGEVTLHVELEAGTPEGHAITFEMEANESPDLIPGDLVLHVHSRPHPPFTRLRNGLDLEMILPITLKEALLGFSREFKHLDDEEVVRLSRSNITPYDTVVKVSGKGMPKLHMPSERGDLYIKLQFSMPTSLTPQQRQLLEKHL